MSPLLTFGANSELVAALHRHGARFMVIGGVATTFHVPQRQSNDPGELDLLIEPTPQNAARVIAALASLGVTGPDLTIERLARRSVQVPVKMGGYFYTDIVTPSADEDFAAMFEHAEQDWLATTLVKVIAKADQVARLRKSDLPKHRRDVELLESAMCSAKN